MNWFLIALIAPALWSVTNHIDKYLLSQYFKSGGTGALLIFSSLIGLAVVPLIFIFHPEVIYIPSYLAVILIINGLIYVLGLLPYLYALERDEASIVVPLFQTIPLFGYVLGYFFLDEVLNMQQILAGLLIIGGAIALSFDITQEKVKLKHDVFGLMFLASLLVSINGFIFKYVAIQTDFWTTSFWEYLGFIVLAVVLFSFIPTYRKQFLHVVKVNKIPVLGLNGFNEVINIIAKFALNFATLLAPLALVWVVNGFQPFFVFLYGVLLTLFFPHLGVENIARRHLTHKLLAISIMFLGTYLLNRS